jgi:hypothetical protein
MRKFPSWVLHFLKLEDTIGESWKKDGLGLGFIQNPQLVKFVSKIECGERHHWFKLIGFKLSDFFIGPSREYLTAMREHAPLVHYQLLMDMVGPTLQAAQENNQREYEALRKDQRIVPVLIGRCGLCAQDQLIICYLADLLAIKRRLGVVVVELPGHRLWLKLHEIWVP